MCKGKRMPFVSVTRAHLSSPLFVDAFLADVVASNAQALAARGNLGTELLGEDTHAYWTKSIWVDQTTMREFMSSGRHAEAMPRLRKWCDEAAVVHWEQDSEELPSWTEAHRRLVSEGRPSAVEQPSPVNQSVEIPSPVLPA